jgi:hypothetical protein
MLGETMAILFYLYLSLSYSQILSSSSLKFESIEKALEELEELDPKKSESFEQKLFPLINRINNEVQIKEDSCKEDNKNQNCFRDILKLKKQVIEQIYLSKKKYTLFLHQQQLSNLEKAKDDYIKKLEAQF